MRVLVTGASGMLGLNLVSLLKDRDYEIVAMINRGSLKKRPWAKDLLEGCELIETRVEDFKGPLEVDTAFHLAAVLKGPTMKVNYEGTLNMLKEVKTRSFLLVSSILALGDSLRESSSEDAVCKPKTGYERSKCEAEKAVLSAEGIRPIIVRPGWIYGPYSINPDILMIARWMKRGIKPVLISENLSLGLVHAKDVARAMIYLIEREYKGIFNVRGPRMYRMGEMLDIMEDFLGKKGLKLPVPRIAVKLASRWFDVIRYLDLAPPDITIDKLLETGFRPSIDLNDGLREALSWMKDHGLL